MSLIKKLVLLILIFTIILCSSINVYAPAPTGGEEEYPGQPEYDSKNPEDVNNALAAGKAGELDWGVADQSQIDPAYTGMIPPNQVKVNQVQDQSKLTYEQLAHNGFANYDNVQDKSKLDPAVRDRILASKAAKDVRTTTKGPTTGTLTQNGFEFDNLGELDVGNEIKIRDAEGIKYNPPNLTVEKANAVEFMGITNEKVEKFNGNTEKKTYTVKKANSVQAGCFNARDVQNSSFTLNSDMKMRTSKDIQTRIIYGFRNEFTVKSTGKDNELIADPRECLNPTYKAKNTNITFEHPDYDEIIEASNETKITLSQDYGLECIEFTPIGNYIYKSDKIEKTFALKAETQPHKVCLRKYSEQTYKTDQPKFTMVDFIAKKLVSNGIINYKRFYYNYYANPVLLITPNLMNHANPNSAFSSVFRLNDEFHQITSAEVFNSNIKNRITFSNFVSIKELNSNRYWEVHPEITEVAENLVQTYTTVDFPEVEVYQQITKSGNVQVIPPDHLVFDTEFFIFK